jgi:hypothetical protein
MGVSSFAAGIEPARRYRLLPYYFAMRLHRCHLTRRLVEKWWGDAAAEPITKAWLDILAALPVEHRSRLVRWLDRGPIHQPVPPGLDRVLTTAAAVNPPKFITCYIDDLMSVLRRGVTVSFLEAWLELRLVRRFYIDLATIAPGVEFPMARLRQLIPSDGAGIREAFRLCATGPEGVSLLMRPELEGLAELELMAALDNGTPAFLTAFAAMPDDRRASFARHYSQMAWGLRSGGAELLPAILRRWDGAPLLAELVRWIPRFPKAQRAALLASPDHVARQLSKAMRGNSEDACVDGSRHAINADPERALSWLTTSPQHFVETCLWLAGYGGARSSLLLRRAAALPLFQPRPTPDGSADWLVQLDRLLQSHLSLARRMPEFLTWDKHFAGTKVLKRSSIEDVAHRLLKQIPLLQMWWLQDQIKPELALHPEEHASLFRATLLENRRPLTRFLREHRRGRDPRFDHPANQQWLARNSARFNVDAWLNPPVATEAGWALAVERDPLEILKIGSYVGSCLALGGFNAHATVAILLDINKRVVIARNARGGFVARQVIAISEDGKLICYGVYSHTKETALHDAFERYATEWASRLGLPLAKGEDEVSTRRVPPLTVKTWYDDGLWERFWA